MPETIITAHALQAWLGEANPTPAHNCGVVSEAPVRAGAPALIMMGARMHARLRYRCGLRVPRDPCRSARWHGLFSSHIFAPDARFLAFVCHRRRCSCRCVMSLWHVHSNCAMRTWRCGSRSRIYIRDPRLPSPRRTYTDTSARHRRASRDSC